MDIVYVLGKGSLWKNNELRYSLRSIEKFCTGFDHVYIVGEDPGFVEGITILPYPDKSAYNREKNIFEKIVHACEHEQVSDDFLFMNDDHFFLQPTNIRHFPYFHREPLEKSFKARPAGDTYRMSLKNCFDQLTAAGKPTKHFDVHTPIIYNKKKFLELQRYDWTLSYGMVIKSLYCNHNNIWGQAAVDLKFNNVLPVVDIVNRMRGHLVFSVGDNGLTNEMKILIQQKYSSPSRWEKSPG